MNDVIKTGYEKLLSSLGLTKKAGKLIIGTEAVCDAVRSHKISMIIVSDTASENTKKRISNCAAYYKARIEYINVTPDDLGAAIGKTATACVGVADENFNKLIESNLTKPV